MASYTNSLDKHATPVGVAIGHSPGSILRAMRTSTLSRFLAVGGVSYIVNQALLYLLYEHTFGSHSFTNLGPLRHLDAGLFLASALAVELSILVRFGLNDCWTFRGRGHSPFFSRLVQSNLSSLGSPVISLAAVNLLTPALGISYLLANSLGIGLGLAWNWSWSSRVIWRQQLPAEVRQRETS